MSPLRCVIRRFNYLCLDLKNIHRIRRSPVTEINSIAEHNIFCSDSFTSIAKRSFCKMENSEQHIPNKEEISKKLTPLQYHVTQEKGTERPFTGEFDKKFDEGTYSCIVCNQYLFSSNTKYDSGCGWPAFNDVLDKGRIKLLPDTSGGRIRTEVQCSKCSAHLGHVFDDGPKPTGKRYCINSASISFSPPQADGKST